MDLFQGLRNRGWTGIGLANLMVWFGEPGKVHRDNVYISTDPSIISKQCELMQCVGIQGVIVTTKGALPTTFTYQATAAIQKECERRGMKFALMLDQWLVKSGNALVPNPTQTVIDYLTSWPVSPAYLSEKYVLSFIPPNAAIDWGKVQAATGYVGLEKHAGYSWPEGTNTLATLARDNSNAAMKIPGLCIGFNDAGCMKPDGTRDYSLSVWGTGPARVLDHQAGNFWFDQIDVTPLTAKYVGLVTWNDADEGSAIEHFISVLTGVRLR